MVLRLLGDVLPGKALHLTPSYRTHAEMFIDSTPITLDELENASGGTVILANTNNPDGRSIMPDFLADRLGRLYASSGWLVVDERSEEHSSELQTLKRNTYVDLS